MTSNLILAKFFRISTGQCFVYDGLTNQILTLGKSFDGKSEKEILSKLADEGVLYRGGFEKAEWSVSYNDTIYTREHKLRDLVLQITRTCNLDCSYCVYSGNFKGMKPHFNESMSEEIIRESIDFFALHSDLNDEDCSVSLYGGEAFLKFPLVKYAVAYAKSCLQGKRVKYGVSSNGTCFSDEVLKWLVDNPDVIVTVTLNGDYQDETRKTVGGKGSLDIIMKSIEKIKNEYPDVWKNQIEFITNLASTLQIPALRRFYSEKIGKIPIFISRVNVDGTDIPELKRLVTVNFEEEKVIDKQLLNEYVYNNDSFLNRLYDVDYSSVKERIITKDNKIAYVGSCFPFSFRLFVRADGSFNMCEKVNDSLNLGNVKQGYKDNEIMRLYNGMKDYVSRNCLNCWAQRMCSFCYQNFVDENGNIMDRLATGLCERSRISIQKKLITYCEKTLESNR